METDNLSFSFNKKTFILSSKEQCKLASELLEIANKMKKTFQTVEDKKVLNDLLECDFDFIKM